MKKVHESGELPAILAGLNEEYADKLTSWAELYHRLKAAAKAFTSAPGPASATAAIGTLLSFVLALEELPEEGDVVVIARRLNEILLTRPDLTGIDFYVTEGASKQEVDSYTASVREEALRIARMTEAMEEAADIMDNTGRLLH